MMSFDSHKPANSVFVAFVAFLLSACTQWAQTSLPVRLALGEIRFSSEAENCGTGKCYSFSTTSRVIKNSKQGVALVREPVGTVQGTAVFFSGGGGTGFGGSEKMTSDALAAGYRTVHVKWETGWFVGTPRAYEGFRSLAVHPATVTDYLKKHFGEPEKPFVLWGSSGGGAQIAYMLSFYGIDEVATSAIISGGFWMGRIDIGSLDENLLNAHLHYSETARKAIDQSFGFDETTPGPCELRDKKCATLLRENSAAFGGDYRHPNTSVYLLYGGNDTTGALNQGLLYYEQLVAHGSPRIRMQVVEGAPHGVHLDPKGCEVTKKILLAQLAADIERGKFPR